MSEFIKSVGIHHFLWCLDYVFLYSFDVSVDVQMTIPIVSNHIYIDLFSRLQVGSGYVRMGKLLKEVNVWRGRLSEIVKTE